MEFSLLFRLGKLLRPFSLRIYAKLFITDSSVCCCCTKRDMSNNRYFPNPFPDYSSNITAKDLLDESGLRLNPTWDQNVRKCIATLNVRFEDGIKHTIDPTDQTVYTGNTGIALLFFRMWDKLDRRQNDKYLRRALEYIEPALKRLENKRLHANEPSFLCGEAGSLACGAVFYHFLSFAEKSQHCIQRLLSICDDVKTADVPDELLFGRSGYLYCILFVRHYVGNAAVDDVYITKIVDAIVASGTNLSKRRGSRCPLMYKWYGDFYAGAAHGLAGIFFILMRSEVLKNNEQLKNTVKQCIDYLITWRFPSGNYPASLETEEDLLVHWCHGAPGFILMFIEAHKTYGDENYLREAKSCAEVIWKRGLLKKGYGLCHGPAGNGYGFLHLYQLTHDIKYLYRALKFAEWMFNYGNHGARVADTPYSLFEGMAGTLYYLIDILRPEEAAFPAFYC